MTASVEHSPFDPKKAVTFDLPNGQVHLVPGHVESDNGRAVIVPAAALDALAAAAGEPAARELGLSIGRSLGTRLSGRLDVRSGGLDEVVTELATEVALVGLGTLSLERWGRALVVCVSEVPLNGRPGDALITAAIEGLLSVATGREVRALLLAREGASLRVLVGKGASIERVAGWLAGGVAWGEALTRLHAPHEEAVS